MKRQRNHDFVEGFTTTKGVLLDLDRVTFKEAQKVAFDTMRIFRLKGFLLLRSSQINYHVVFNRYLSWRKVCKVLASVAGYYRHFEHDRFPHLTNWVLMQINKESETLRISTKKVKGKPRIRKPRIVCIYGEQDKLIADYLRQLEEES